MTFVNDLKTEAYSLGFSILGVTCSEPHSDFEIYDEWLSNGRHANMDYLANERSRQRRSNPNLILKDCQSFLVFGMAQPVLLEHDESVKRAPIGRIAAYACFIDYHEVIKPRLDVLSSWIESNSSRKIESLSYTDTGPILERSYASKAGLGWIGKNSCLISPTLGSYLLLGEILTSLEIESDQPFSADRCGNCRRCIDACPTNCILPNRTIDCQHCLSYLTIENKGEIPIDLRPMMGTWIFGCDLCQTVCPWNSHIAHSYSVSPFETALGWLPLILQDEILLNREQFNEKFRHSPIQRARHSGYLRNVAVAIGNTQDTDAVKPLTMVMKTESESLVRRHIIWALGQINTRKARQAIENALRNDPDEHVRIEANYSLENSHNLFKKENK